MVLRGAVVRLVNRHGGMHDFGSDRLLVDDWLHSLVDVMMDMLAFDSGSSAGRVPRFVGRGGVFELARLLLESRTAGMLVAVFEFLVGDIFHVMAMLFREDLLVLDRLDGRVVVILMNLAVNSFLSFFVSSGFGMFPCDGA